MAQYDGSIRIGTGIDEKGFKAGSKELEAGARSLAKSVSDSLGKGAKIALQKQTDAFVKMNQQYANQEQKVKDLGEKLHELQRTQIETPIFKETSRELSSTEKKLDNLYGTLRRLEAEGKENTAPYKQAIVQIDLYKKKVSELQNQLKELKYSGEAYQPADTSKVEQDIAAAEQKQMQMYTALQTAADALTQKTNERIAKEETVREKIAQEAAEEQRLAQIRINAVATNDEIIAKVERIKQIEQEIADLKAAGITEGYEDYDSRIRELEQLKQEVKDYANGTNEMQNSYKRLGQALTDLNGKLINIARIMMTVKQSFSSSDVNVSGYEKLQSSLGELGGIAIRAAETVKNAFATLKQGPTAVIHGLSSSLMNMANTVNSAMGSVLSGGLEKFGDGIGVVLGKLQQLASGIGSGISSALDIAKEKLAGFAGSVINTILHPFQMLKNVATTTLGGIANIIKGVLGSALEGLKNKAAGLAATIMNGIVHPFKTLQSVAKKAFNVIRSGISVVKKMGKAFSSIAGMAKKAFSSITSGTKKSSGLFSTFASRLKGIALSLLIFNWISKGFNAMISGMKKGFENLAGYSDSYAQSVQSMKNAMSTLGNQFAAAFAPIVQMVIPWINSLINSLTTAMTYVAQFIAVLGGKGTFTKAKQQQDAYNKSLGGTAKAADKARGALAKFDDLDVLQKQEDTSGGGGANETDPSDMFEEVEIEDKWENIADWFREMWENSDFYELGNLLGTKLAEALSSINWGPIKKAAEGIGKSIGTLINGFVETDNLGASIGQTIGNAISTGISGINAFLDNTHWDSVGVFIGEALNGLVNAISWEDIGNFFAEKWNAIFSVIGEAARTFEWSNFGLELSNGINTAISDFDWAESGARLGDLVKGILDTIIAFFENTNWQELGNNVATFIGSIDWTGLFEKLSQGIGAALGGLAAFLWGLIEDAWSNVISWWNEVAFEDGKFTITGLLNGIGEGLRNIGTWIYEHIFQPFIEGFKNAFGIHSPSTVMIEMGHFLMEGLFNGISSLVNKVVSVFEKLKNKIVGVWNTVKEKTTEIWAGIVNQIKKPINVILGFMETLSNGVIAAMNFMIQALNKLSFDVPDWIPGIGGKTFGFNLTELKEVSIPRLATGAVIRGGNPFMAILGDQPAGQTNIEAPLATIEKALENVMSRNGYAKESVPVTINLNYDGEIFARLSISDILSELDRQGYNVNVLGVT